MKEWKREYTCIFCDFTKDVAPLAVTDGEPEWAESLPCEVCEGALVPSSEIEFERQVSKELRDEMTKMTDEEREEFDK